MAFNDFQTKKLETMIGEFKHGKQMEFEIRFAQPNEDTFKQVFAQFVKDHDKLSTIEQSISIMTDSTDMAFDRKEMYFQNGVQDKTVHNRKLRKDMLKIFTNSQEIYRIAVASELTVPEFGMHLAHRIRIKLRCSIIDDSGLWRYDFTAAIQLEKSQLSQLKEYKQKMFPSKKMDPAEFLSYIPSMPYMRYEFEIEYVGKPKDLTVENIATAVKHFTSYISPNFEESSSYQMTIYELAKLIEDDKYRLEQFRTKNNLKQLSNQPKNLTKSIWFKKVLPVIDNYYISDKADGERCFVVFSKTKVEIVLADRVYDMTDVFLKTSKTSKTAKSDETPLKINTIIDAEIVNLDRDDPTKSKQLKLYLFDILLHNGSRVLHEPFEKRETYLDEYVAKLANTEKKILRRLDSKSYGKTIREIYSRQTRAYPIDGLVVTPAKAAATKYHRADYFNMVVYKWKDPENLSVDFLILKPPTSMLGTKPYMPRKDYELYFLFSGINSQDARILNLPDIKGYREMIEGIPESGNYFPIQFSHESFPYSYMYYHPLNASKEDLHQQIGEFVWDIKKEEWRLDRTRPDKAIQVKQGLAFGNNYKVAEEIFNMYQNPLTIDMLIDVDSAKNVSYSEGQNYFQVLKSEMHKPLTKFNNFVKAQLIKQLENKPWVVDISAGRGGDLFTYNGFGVQNLLCMDIDQSALEELSERAWEIGNTNSYMFSRAPAKNARVYIMQNDLNTPADTTLETIEHRGIPVPIGQVDGVVTNLSIHYLMTSEKALNNIVKLVNKLLKPGGVFIFTTFDGQRIFKLLEKVATGDSWDIEENDTDSKKLVKKWSIRKNYKDKAFKMGLTVGVVHPFSQGAYYDEPLADIDQIVSAFESEKFKLMQRGSFADWLEKYKKFNSNGFDQITADDKRYGALYSYVSLVKPIVKPPRE